MIADSSLAPESSAAVVEMAENPKAVVITLKNTDSGLLMVKRILGGDIGTDAVDPIKDTLQSRSQFSSFRQKNVAGTRNLSNSTP